MARWGMIAFPEEAEALVGRLHGDTVLREAAAASGIELPAQDSSALELPLGDSFVPSEAFEYLNALEIRRDIAISVTSAAKTTRGKEASETRAQP
jgi:hypothetical protein